jgi:hypothetical protein
MSSLERTSVRIYSAASSARWALSRVVGTAQHKGRSHVLIIWS